MLIPSPGGERPAMNSNARLDPLELLRQQEAQRLPWLVPERHRRMAESPFAFFRGAAIVMAADLGRQPHSGLMVQLCGDAHLLNFGFYGSPERQLLFGINDFDVGLPRFCGQVVRSHAMTLRLSIDDQPDQIKTPVHGAAKARGH